MSLVCAQCSRVNPPEAAYCYHDGAALAGRAGGPINAGAAPFPNQFVFPDGLACRNFDQLALACQQNWSAALKLLQQGFLGSFFGGMGRVDLAMAAQEAAKFPDLDRGLDQLLAKLPSQALQAPKVQAEPTEINLGQVKIGEDRHTELHLTNLGMRLLYGTVTTNCKWLALGDPPGHPEKMFQFGAEAIIPVQVRGQGLRAGSRPIEGKLEIDSNGGALEITVKADVPITPFGSGLFAGAISPRQIAEKAKANVKDAVPCFERGDVANWYAANGWDYPVKGPIMPSTGSIQQFFEALGVAKAPKVEFSPKALDLSGGVGKTIDAALEVSTTERKVVYGWATCDQPWVEIGKTKLHGKSASIPITIRIPDPSPPTLQATLTIMGNGTQKATVPLSVTVAGGKAGVALESRSEEPVPMVVLEDEAPVVVQLLDEPAPAGAIMPTPSYAPAPMVTMESPAMAPSAAVETVPDDNPFAITDSPAITRPGFAATQPTVVTAPKPPPGLPLAARLLLHIVPLVLLSCMCPILIAWDYFSPAKQRAGGDEDAVDDKNPLVKLVFDEGRDKDKKDYTDSMTFAVHKLEPGGSVKLNWYENGFGNSTVLKIDGNDKAFGNAPQHGKWVKGFENSGTKAGEYAGGKTRTFDIDGIWVTQTVTIVPGDPIEYEPDKYKRFLNTCLVRYTIHNRDSKSHRIGLRVLMDTCIGKNDGAPFTLPGVKEVVDTQKEFMDAEVPDFVQVLEKESLREPGIVVHLNMRLGDKYEMPSRFLLTRYPGHEEKFKWEVPKVDIKRKGEDMGDSAVVIYWSPKDLGVNKTRELAFTYGLGSVSESGNKLGITIGGSTHVNGELTVLALINDRDAKKATLNLPKGLEFVDPKSATQDVEPARGNRPTPVTWRVRAREEGKHNVSVTTSNGLSNARRVTITAKSLFN